jgi:hypothetical protein
VGAHSHLSFLPVRSDNLHASSPNQSCAHIKGHIEAAQRLRSVHNVAQKLVKKKQSEQQKRQTYM